MKNRTEIFLIVLLFLPAFLYSKNDKNPDYEFIQEDTFYSFQAQFFVKAEPDCLLNLVYDFKNVSKYSSGAKSVKLIRQGEDWYELTFIYKKYLLFENQSTWRRNLDRRESRIDFILISNSNNFNIMPDVISSSGYYQFKAVNDSCLVEYFQQCKLKPGLLKDNYIKMAKKEAIRFLKEFKEFLNLKMKDSHD